MPIFELEPKYKIGPVCWGKKLGARFDQVDSGVCVNEQNGWLSASGVFATIQGKDQVRVTTWTDASPFGLTQLTEDLVGEAINKHWVVGRKLRYIPD